MGFLNKIKKSFLNTIIIFSSVTHLSAEDLPPKYIQQEVNSLIEYMKENTNHDFLDYTKTILRNGKHYDVKTFELANGRYEEIHAHPHNLRFVEEYKNGLPHGVNETYYGNGNLMSSEQWVEGVMHGIRESYNEDGSLNYRYCFQDGLIAKLNQCEENKG